MDKLGVGSCQQFGGREAEGPLERRIQPLEEAVEAADGEHVEREVEEAPLHLRVGPPRALCHEPVGDNQARAQVVGIERTVASGRRQPVVGADVEQRREIRRHGRWREDEDDGVLRAAQPTKNPAQRQAVAIGQPPVEQDQREGALPAGGRRRGGHAAQGDPIALQRQEIPERVADACPGRHQQRLHPHPHTPARRAGQAQPRSSAVGRPDGAARTRCHNRMPINDSGRSPGKESARPPAAASVPGAAGAGNSRPHPTCGTAQTGVLSWRHRIAPASGRLDSVASAPARFRPVAGPIPVRTTSRRPAGGRRRGVSCAMRTARHGPEGSVGGSP